ncbi:MAG: flagellin FliC3 [Lachnospiraceae bacterium]|nr:flagellin FliC3 [Lachnospiraceae bacterium]
MRINYNVSAMLSNNALANNDSLLAASLERLSSGLKINHAKDNPAGLAMSKRMNAQLVGLAVANQNSSDGVSVAEIADGALSEVADMLQRMNELAVQASNGTYSEEDQAMIQEEVSQLMEEITRISETTEFNGQPLLDGEFDVKGYTSNVDVQVNTFSEKIPTGEYMINSLTIEELNGERVVTNIQLDQDYGVGFPADAKYVFEDDFLTITGSDQFELKLDLQDVESGDTINNLEINLTDVGPMRLQIGANEGQVLEVQIPTVSLRNLGIEDLDMSTQDNAQAAIAKVKGAISYVSSVRGKLGAYQNRMEATINSLDVTSENMTAAYSRIMDVDMAEEMTNYTTYQVLTQAGTSMLAQANERPSQVLQLLQ